MVISCRTRNRSATVTSASRTTRAVCAQEPCSESSAVQMRSNRCLRRGLETSRSALLTITIGDCANECGSLSARERKEQQMWKKLGRIFEAGKFGWMHSHAQNPFPEDLGGGRYQIHFATRDDQN